MRKTYGLIAVALALAGCAPAIDSGNSDVDAIVHKVVFREGWYSGCIEMLNVMPVSLRPDDELESMSLFGMHAESFSNPDTVDAAIKIAISAREAIELSAENETVKLVGDPDVLDENCLMRVSQPQFSGDYAFLYFRSPGGDIGWYSFRREGRSWRVDERVHVGWW